MKKINPPVIHGYTYNEELTSQRAVWHITGEMYMNGAEEWPELPPEDLEKLKALYAAKAVPVEEKPQEQPPVRTIRSAVLARIRRIIAGAAAAVLLVSLSATGIYDFCCIMRLDSGGTMYDSESEVTHWLSSNANNGELVLTPLYSMSEATLSGCMMYNGYPYYAWSAGYDTNYRFQTQKEIYTSRDKDHVSRLVSTENISYILFDNYVELDGEQAEEDTIRSLYPCVFKDSNDVYRVYDTRNGTGAAEA